MRLNRLILNVIIFFMVPFIMVAAPIVVQPHKVVRRIDAKFFGSNVSFWINDAAALKDGKIADALKKLPAGLLRFPGGAVSDNYYWETKTVADPRLYPFRAGSGALDFDKFMALVRRVGAQAVIVVNTATWVWRGDIAGGVKEAADWVRYCKTKGYQVRYWEIGNETYLHTAMTAHEYAQLVNRYATAMKAVDPAIQIGANGPWYSYGVGLKDRLPASERAKLDKLPGSGDPLDTIREISNKARRAYRRTRPPIGAAEWWPTLARICGRHINFLIVHDYFYSPKLIVQLPTQLKLIEADFRNQYPGKTFPILMSEFNVGRNVAASQQPLEIFDIVGAMLKGGVGWSCFWPLRFPRGNWRFKALLYLRSKQPEPAYEMMHFLARRLIGAKLVKTDRNNVGAYAVRRGGKLTVFVSGRTLKRLETIRIKVLETRSQNATVLHCRIGDNGSIKIRRTHALFHGDAINILVRPRQFAVVNIPLHPPKSSAR